MQLPLIAAIVTKTEEVPNAGVPEGKVFDDGFREAFAGAEGGAADGPSEMPLEDMSLLPGDIPGAAAIIDGVPAVMADALVPQAQLAEVPQAQLAERVLEGTAVVETALPGAEAFVEAEPEAVPVGDPGVIPLGGRPADKLNLRATGGVEQMPPNGTNSVMPGVSEKPTVPLAFEDVQVLHSGSIRAEENGAAVVRQPVPLGALEADLRIVSKVAQLAAGDSVVNASGPVLPAGEAMALAEDAAGQEVVIPRRIATGLEGQESPLQQESPAKLRSDPAQSAAAAVQQTTEPARQAPALGAVAEMPGAAVPRRLETQRGMGERESGFGADVGVPDEAETSFAPGVRVSESQAASRPVLPSAMGASGAEAISVAGQGGALVSNDGAFAVEPAMTELATGEVRGVSRETVGGPPPVFSAPETPRNVALQIAEVIRASGERAVELRLQPEELGRVQLTMSQDATGALTVSLNVERAETLDLLRRNIDLLGADLRELGYESVDFSFSGDGTGGDASPDGESRPGPRSGGVTQETPESILPSRRTTAGDGIDLRL